MSNKTEEITWTEELNQSNVFGDQYKERLDGNVSSAISVSSFKDVQDMFSSIVVNNKLTSFQLEALTYLFFGFHEIRNALDPEKLKTFNFTMNNEDEFLVYRKSSIGLTNIIIHEEETIALSFIPFDPNSQSSIEFTEDSSILLSWAFKFFAGN